MPGRCGVPRSVGLQDALAPWGGELQGYGVPGAVGCVGTGRGLLVPPIAAVLLGGEGSPCTPRAVCWSWGHRGSGGTPAAGPLQPGGHLPAAIVSCLSLSLGEPGDNYTGLFLYQLNVC